MKLKRWLSRALVLAMVVALMIPVPVAAKGGGGKLVKSVKTYTFEKSGRWVAESLETFKYDKKNYPVEFDTVDYNRWFLGVPVGGNKYVETAKYKYKGGSPKSAKFKDGAGKVTQVRKYKKGKVVSVAGSTQSSTPEIDYDVNDNEVFKGDNVTASAYNNSYTYNKYGLATSSASASTYNSVAASGVAEATTNNSATTFNVTHKKGVPSFISTISASSRSSSNAYGTSSSQTNADGTYIEVYNGAVSTGKYDYIWSNYSTFNGKGLVIERGRIRIDTKTGAQVVFPSERIDYASKKGKVTQAVVYDLETNEAGVVTKTTPSKMYQFKYGKAKASKVRYLSMINSFVGATGAFSWF